MAYTEGQLLIGSDGKPYVVRNGVPVLDTPAGGMLITKPVTQKDAAETTSAAQRAADAVAASPYREQSAADDFQIKHSQAIDAKAKSDNVEATARMATMAPNSNLHGEAYFNAINLPENERVLARAYARGDLGSRAGGITTSMLPIIQHAMNYDPTTSATTFPARVKMQQDLAGNQPNTLGGGIRAMEQMLFHGRDVLHNGAALANYGPGLIGSLGNKLKVGYEGMADDPRLAAYNQSVNNYAPESQKGVAGAAGVGAERQERHDAYGASLSQPSRAAALQADATMAFDRTGAVNDQYKRLMGKDIVDLLSPDAKKAYDEIMSGGYDAKGKALHPAAGYVQGSVFGSSGPGGASGGDPGGPPPPVGPIATGGTKAQSDPAREKALDAMLRSGADFQTINSVNKQMGGTDLDQQSVESMRDAVNKGYKGPTFDSSIEVPSTLMNRVSASPMATGIVSGTNAAMGGLPGALSGMTPQIQAMAALNPKSALAGDIVGSGIGAAGIEGAMGRVAGNVAARYGAGAASRALASPVAADALFGGVSGASADPTDPITGAAIGVAGGVGGGMFGRGAAKFVGQTARGVQNTAVNTLRDAGVPLTVGQALSQSGRIGSIAKGFEDKLTSAPIVGDMIRSRRLEGMRGFNGAAFDQGLAPIGATTNGAIGESGVDAAQSATSKAYRDALSGVALTSDQPFRTDITAAMAKGGGAPTYGPDFSSIMKDEVGPIVSGSPTINGEQFQQLKRTLGGYEGQYGNIANGTPMVPPAPLARRVSSAFGDLDNSLDGLVSRQAPDVLPAYGAANGAYRNTKILQDATNRARNGTRVGEPGVFAPSQLADAAASNARTFGGTQGTTQQPFFDLTRAGQSVLPSSIPDSGTAGRLSALALPSALGGAGYAFGGKDGAEDGSIGGLGLGAALAMGGTRTGQRALVSGLLDRPQTLVRVGNALVDRRMLPGMFGAGFGTTLAAQ